MNQWSESFEESQYGRIKSRTGSKAGWPLYARQKLLVFQICGRWMLGGEPARYSLQTLSLDFTELFLKVGVRNNFMELFGV